MGGNKITIEFTEDIITFIKLLKPRSFSVTEVGFDVDDLYGESHLYDFMGHVLGVRDHVIDGTVENTDGAFYDRETTERLNKIDKFITENLMYIEEILHQFCTEGIKVGKYTCFKQNHIWKYEG